MLKVHNAITARRDAVLKGERSDGGFTLIELLIVVLIIGVLAAIAIPVYLSTVNTAKNETAKATITQAITALQADFIQANSYPTDIYLSDFKQPGSEITVTYTGGGATFCVSADASGGTVWGATQAAGAPQEGLTCP